MMKILGIEIDQTQTGYAIEMPNGHLGVMPCGEFDMQFFRGQNKDYRLIPSFQRDNICNDNITHCVAYIQRETFKETLKLTAYCDNLGLDSYDFDSIAQHYGFATNYLDITADREVALFFAYTYCDKNNGKYHLIDFKNNDYEPTLYTIFTFSFFDNPNLLVPINFQSVLRPQKQRALTLNVSGMNNKSIAKYFTKHTLSKDIEAQKRAKNIYDKFNGGEYLFPKNEIIDKLERDIKSNKKLNKTLFLKYCKEFGKDKDKLKQELENSVNGYKIIDDNFDIDKQILMQIQDEVKKKIAQSNVTTRLVYV